jgi:KipI family sensor histidine kinase inhibitor
MGEAAMLAECSIDDISVANQHAVALAQRLAVADGISATLGINAVVVRFDPLQHMQDDVTRAIHEAIAVITLQEEGERRIVDVHVRYGDDAGSDLVDAASALGINAQKLVALHTSQPWRVLMIGFAPGFPYIGPLPPALHLPRRSTPRAAVPAGSVAIAAGVTGIYPSRLPGGWHLIGRTEVELFNTNHEPPALLKAGDFVRFIATHVEGD